MQKRIVLTTLSLVVLGLLGGLSFIPQISIAAETAGSGAGEVKGVDPKDDQWFVRCDEKEKDGKKQKQCEVFQRLVVKKTNKRLVEFAVAYLGDDKKAHGTFILPLGILIQNGAELRIDGNPPAKYEIRYCTPDGCFVHFQMTEEILKAMRSGNKIAVTFVLAIPKKISVEMSLKGFGKALKELS